jgi:hypothetical protein
LINLELFDAQENHLTGGIPPLLSSCTNLLSVKVEGNQLSAPIPTSLGSLTNLEVFYLFANNFTGSMPEEICALRSGAGRLEYLAADCNGIDFSCSCCTKLERVVFPLPKTTHPHYLRPCNTLGEKLIQLL